MNLCYFSKSLDLVSDWLLCQLVLILFCLLWCYIWIIQWRLSFYICILSGVVFWDSSPIHKKCWLCLYKPLHSYWRFWKPLENDVSLLPNVFFLIADHTFTAVRYVCQSWSHVDSSWICVSEQLITHSQQLDMCVRADHTLTVVGYGWSHIDNRCKCVATCTLPTSGVHKHEMPFCSDRR